MRRKVFIVGSSLTRVDRWYEKGLIELAYEALSRTIDDSGIKPEVIIVSNMLSSSLQDQDNLGAYIASNLGFRLVPSVKVEAACGSGGAAILTAYTFITSGLVNSVAIIGVEKMSDHVTSKVLKALAKASDSEYELFYGTTFASLSALMMRYYMNKYSISRHDISEWPVLMHEYALRNPYAQVRKRISKDEVIKSPIIADPIRLLDSSPIGDGAAAAILTNEELARKTGKPLVELASVWTSTDTVDLSSRSRLDALEAAIDASRKAYRLASIDPKNVDVVELHDAFTIHGVLLLEDLGFVEKGRAVKELINGRFRPGDKPAVNPSGGLKARGHPVGATGIYQLVEVYQQIIGTFPGVRVDAEVGVTCNMGGVGSSVTVSVLRLV